MREYFIHQWSPISCDGRFQQILGKYVSISEFLVTTVYVTRIQNLLLRALLVEVWF